MGRVTARARVEGRVEGRGRGIVRARVEGRAEGRGRGRVRGWGGVKGYG